MSSNNSNSNSTSIFVSIEVGNKKVKKDNSGKKKASAKKKDELPKGQLTLTQMPFMSAAKLPVDEDSLSVDDSEAKSLSVFEDPKSPTGKTNLKKKFDSVKDVKEPDSPDSISPLGNKKKSKVEPMEDLDIGELTVIYPEVGTKEEVIFTVGDLVEMQHPQVEHYVQFGLVGKNHGSLVEVFWLWYARDGNNDLVCVEKKTTVNPSFLTRLAKFDEPLDPAKFNWWKYKGIMHHFSFYADGRGWRFENMSW